MKSCNRAKNKLKKYIKLPIPPILDKIRSFYNQQPLSFLIKLQPGISHHSLCLTVGGEQLQHLALKAAASLIPRGYCCPHIHLINPSPNLPSMHCASITVDWVCAGLAHLEWPHCLVGKAHHVKDLPAQTTGTTGPLTVSHLWLFSLVSKYLQWIRPFVLLSVRGTKVGITF